MQAFNLNGTTLHYRYRAGAGLPIVFLNSLGTDFRIWDDVIARLGPNTPILCLDKRGHGLSDEGSISMDLLVADVAALMDHLDVNRALICGVSVGGMIAQGLTTARPDLVAGLILCCTGTRIGDADGWNARIEAVKIGGIASISKAILDRWFSPGFHRTREVELAIWRNMLTRTTPLGYAGVCAAIRDTDFTTASRGIQVPTHCLAGADDLATPAPVVHHLADTIPGATFDVIETCGHLPCIEAPNRVARAISNMSERLR